MRNYKKYKLSKTDKLIMDFFWTSDQPNIMARDVLQFFSLQGKKWNQQNIANYLKNLQKIGALRAEVRNGKYYYSPTMTKREWELLPSKNLIADCFNGSYCDFVAAILPPDCSKADIDALQKMLDDYKSRVIESEK